MTDLTQLSLRHAQEALKNRSLSARELTTAYLGAIDARNPALNAYITVTPERALADADTSDARLARGEAGALEGIPLAIKDLFCTKGIRTTAASKMLAEFVPPYESTVTAKLNAAGAVMLGKTNLDEFAMGSSNATSYFGPVVSPWKEEGSDKSLVPGGSSGGSAAAVAAGLCMAATGTDTGGSIRQPAAFCGIVGVKPTYGRASRYGIIAFASSLDQAGMFARNVYDAALTQTVISGHDAKDSTSAPREVPDFTALLGHDLNGMTIGIPKEYRVDGTDPEILALWQQGARWLQDAGAKLVEVSLPHTQHALAVYYVLAPAEASSNLARFDGVRYGLRVTPPSGALADMYEHTRAQGFGREVKRRILIGTYVLSAGYFDAYYRKAQSVRRLIAQDFTHAFTQVDALLTPTAPTPAFALDAKPGDPLLMYLNDVFTIPTSLAGLPAISVPAGLSARGLPLGLQLIGKPFEEGTLFQVAAALETAANFSKRPAQGASV